MNAGKSSCGGVEHYYSVLFNKSCRVTTVSGRFSGIAEGSFGWSTLTCVRLGSGGHGNELGTVTFSLITHGRSDSWEQ